MEVEIGVIGGSGLYAMEALEVLEERRVETPFGEPSDAFVIGRLGGKTVAFLPRHGRGHRILPAELNFRANIWAMKVLGVKHLLAVGAVGSMKEEYRPRDIVVPDQFYDRTRHRADTFFGDGLVAHVSMAEPVCALLAEVVVEAARQAGATVHAGGTYLCMEGPQFSTRAESLVYRSLGMDVIGMTHLQEAKLAREAEIAFASIAMITDYDCWHEEEDDVSAGSIMEVIHHNVASAQQVVRRAVSAIGADLYERSVANGALAHSLVTDLATVPEATLERLAPILGGYAESR